MAWQAIAAAGIGALGSLLNSAQNNRMSSSQMRLQHSMNRELMNSQYQQNVNLWNMENAYNSPAAQMARYQEAGLNPNLIYSQQNTAGSIQSAQAIPTEVPKKESPIAGITSSIQDGLLAYQSMKREELQIEAMREQIRGQKIENDYREIMKLIQKFNLDHQPEVFGWKQNAQKRLDDTFKMKLDSHEHEKTMWDYQTTISKNEAKKSDYEANDGLQMRATIDYYNAMREIQALQNDIASGNLTKAKTSQAYAQISKLQHSMRMDELRIQLSSSGLLLKVAEFNRQLNVDDQKQRQQEFENWLKKNKGVSDVLHELYGSTPVLSTVMKLLEVTYGPRNLGTMYDVYHENYPGGYGDIEHHNRTNH